jgi:hypothetical protein
MIAHAQKNWWSKLLTFTFWYQTQRPIADRRPSDIPPTGLLTLSKRFHASKKCLMFTAPRTKDGTRRRAKSARWRKALG